MGRVTNALVKAGRWQDQTGAVVIPFPAPLPQHESVDGLPIDEYRISTDEEPILVESQESPAPGVPLRPPIPFPTAEQRINRRHESTVEIPASATWVSEPPTETVPAAAVAALPIPPSPAPPLPTVQRQANIADRCKTVTLSLSRIDPALAAFNRDDMRANEKYQTLAVRLFNLASKKGLKTILVTSALEGEGKTTIAVNVAILMARASDKRVLLIDGDGRRPSVARALGIAPARGWSELVSGGCGAQDAIFKLNPSGLYVCADAVRTPRRQTQTQNRLAAQDVFTQSKTEALLSDLEKEFGLIVIDAPPILAFAEAQQLATIADGSIIVVSAARTNHNAVADALKLIPKDRRLGIVLNQSDIEEESTYYGARKDRRPAGVKRTGAAAR